MTQFKHRGVDIKLGQDGRFYTDIDDEQLTAGSLVDIKKRIDRRKTRGRKYNVPCVLVALGDVPRLADLEDEMSMLTGHGYFRGVNLHTNQVKVRFEGHDRDHEGRSRWSHDERLYALPILEGKAEDAQILMLIDLKGAFQGYNTAIAKLKKQLLRFEEYDLDFATRDKEATIESERECAKRLQEVSNA